MAELLHAAQISGMAMYSRTELIGHIKHYNPAAMGLSKLDVEGLRARLLTEHTRAVQNETDHAESRRRTAVVQAVTGRDNLYPHAPLPARLGVDVSTSLLSRISHVVTTLRQVADAAGGVVQANNTLRMMRDNLEREVAPGVVVLPRDVKSAEYMLANAIDGVERALKDVDGLSLASIWGLRDALSQQDAETERVSAECKAAHETKVAAAGNQQAGVTS
jgi:MoxR-like ATPase